MSENLSHNYCIISDLDGTLLNAQQQISEALKIKIWKFQQSHGYLTFATGRPLESVRTYIRETGIRIPVVLCNGAKCFDPVQGKYVYEEYFDNEEYQILLDILAAHFSEDTGIFVTADEKIYCYNATAITKKQAAKDSVSFQLVPTILRLRELLPAKCMIMAAEKRLHEWQTKLTTFNTVHSEKTLLEVMPHGINKNVGCQKLIELLELDETKCYVVGDSFNDYEMIKTAYNGIAVQNAHVEVKHVARWVTQRTNDEGAIAELIDDIMCGVK
ncbi:MAG: HAD family hydrolase [bacterium]|nr:HAD family hydrolase [bacterium]